MTKGAWSRSWGIRRRRNEYEEDRDFDEEQPDDDDVTDDDSTNSNSGTSTQSSSVRTPSSRSNNDIDDYEYDDDDRDYDEDTAEESATTDTDTVTIIEEATDEDDGEDDTLEDILDDAVVDHENDSRITRSSYEKGGVSSRRRKDYGDVTEGVFSITTGSGSASVENPAVSIEDSDFDVGDGGGVAAAAAAAAVNVSEDTSSSSDSNSICSVSSHVDDSGDGGGSAGGGSAGGGSKSTNDDKKKQERLNNLCFLLGTNDSSMTELVLDFDKINGRMAVQEVYDLLPKNTYVSTLRVWNAHIDKQMASTLGRALAGSRSVSRFCLKDCTIVDESGFACLMLGMQHQHSTANRMDVMAAVQNPNSRVIGELAVVNTNLSSLNTDIVSASLPLMKLTSLSLVNINLGIDNGLQFLCDNLEKSPETTSLNLSGNPGLAQPDAMKMLTSSLLEQSKVSNLHLTSCNLDRPCVKQLAKGLLSNPVITSLNLSNNPAIGNDTATYLKQLLENNHNIKSLCVKGCRRIGKRLLKALDDSLRYNNSFLLKLGFSETTSLAILESVDMINGTMNHPGCCSTARVVSP